MSKTEKILITGAHGFLGQHVVEQFKKKRHTIIFTPKHSPLDLMQASDVNFYIKSIQPDYIIHLAARVGGIGANKKNPGCFFYENLLMGVNLMQACFTYGCKKFVNVSTVCSYPKYTPVPFKESDIWNGYPEETNAPYGLAKKTLMVMGQAYNREYNFPCITLIPTNLYGPGDNFNPDTSHVIPALILKITEAVANNWNTISVWGTGKASREFLYVEDCATAIVKAMYNYNDYLMPLNIGTGRSIHIAPLVEILAGLMKWKGNIEWQTDKPDGQPERQLDVSRSKLLLNWTARTGLEAGLKKTIAWFKTTPTGKYLTEDLKKKYKKE